MSNGANSIHKKLRHDLEDYIKAQYFGKSPLLLSAVGQHLDDEGLLYQKPFIESSPAYKSVKDGIQKAKIPDWMKKYFLIFQMQVLVCTLHRLFIRFRPLKMPFKGETCSFPQVLVLVKQSVLCGR